MIGPVRAGGEQRFTEVPEKRHYEYTFDALGRTILAFTDALAASPYPRQIQNLGAPAGFIEAGASDFFGPRGDSPAVFR